MPDQLRSILIVEDEAPIRSLLTEILGVKYKCSSVESASEALRMMVSQRFDLALIDLGLPGMSGVSLCRLTINLNPQTIVIMISGHTDDQSVDDAIKAGASDYIMKPFAVADVVARVDRALKRNSPGAVA